MYPHNNWFDSNTKKGFAITVGFGLWCMAFLAYANSIGVSEKQLGDLIGFVGMTFFIGLGVYVIVEIIRKTRR